MKVYIYGSCLMQVFIFVLLCAVELCFSCLSFHNLSQVADILKDRPSWYHDCRCLDVLSIVPTGSGGTIELLYMQV